MDILTFQQSVADLYRLVLDQLRGDHALRFWAFVPSIHADYGNGLDRYMAFNAGRFAAFSAWLGGRDAFSHSMPTASAVGSRSSELALHCLASRWPGRPVENPRQVPAYRYSRRFGPLPPCFARATLVRRQPFQSDLLLVGGTASIVGEDSQHQGEVLAQAEETFRNLASVVRSACQGPDSSPESDGDLREWLSLFRQLRVYYRQSEHYSVLREQVEALFPGAARVEILPAELCRAELLVEIEGMAVLPAKS
jgi:chorismate lyase/3-hydroxybenzoate synthase